MNFETHLHYVEELELYNITAEPTEYIITNNSNINYSINYLHYILIIIIIFYQRILSA